MKPGGRLPWENNSFLCHLCVFSNTFQTNQSPQPKETTKSVIFFQYGPVRKEDKYLRNASEQRRERKRVNWEGLNGPHSCIFWSAFAKAWPIPQQFNLIPLLDRESMNKGWYRVWWSKHKWLTGNKSFMATMFPLTLF